MYNPQQYAISIEMCLRPKALAKMGDADTIRKDPIEFLDAVLSIYETQSIDHKNKAADFWDRYEHLKGKRLDDIDEQIAIQLVADVRSLFD